MSCDNVITVQDLEIDKKHSTFYREVITGKAGGTGADIDSATNAVTGQTQATLPKVLSNVGFSPAGFDFTTGGTLTERDKAIFYQTDGNWYSWGGVLPKVVPPASSPASTGGIADSAWNVSTSAFMYRDWEGFTAELLAQAGIVDDDRPDEIGTSQRVDAISKICGRKFASVDAMLAFNGLVAGQRYSTGGTTWEYKGFSGGDLTDFNPLVGIHIDDFGAVGDGRLATGEENPSPTNDRLAIQESLRWAAILGNCAVTASPSKAYYWDGLPIIIPSVRNSPDFITKRPAENLWVVDFQGCEFIGPSYTDVNTVLFESGYFDSNGDVVSNWGLPVEQQITANTRLINFSVRNVHTAIKVYNWVYGCEIGNIHGHNVARMVYTKRSFYTNLGQIIHRGAYVTGVPIYRFEDNNNIQPVQSCTSGACDIGYSYSGATEAVSLRDCDIAAFKSCGVDINGPYNIKIDSGYIESNTAGAQAGCVGIRALGGPKVTIDNSWIFGDFPVFDSTSGAGLRLDIRRNNVLSGGARWGFDDLPNQTYGDVELSAVGIAGNNIVDKYAAKDSINIDQDVIVFDPNLGFDYILGRVEQTNRFHTIRTNGQTSRGFKNANLAIGYTITIEAASGGFQKVRYNTNITWHDNVLIYICIKVAHNSGTYEWIGELCKDTFTKKAGSGASLPTYSVDGSGFVVIHTPALPSSGNVGPSAGEIRLM